MKETKLFKPLSRRQFLAGSVGVGSALLAAGLVGFPAFSSAEDAPIKMDPLPYGENALAHYISAGTLSFHYGKHYRAYVGKAGDLIKGTDLARLPLDEIIRKASSRPGAENIFNNAAQAWNHAFYWKSMKPGGGGKPGGKLGREIDKSFGSYEKFKAALADAALTQFGSGWAWVILDDGLVKVIKTGNADNPIAHGRIPLLTIDVWEHAYYLDYQNRRGDYVAAFLDHLVNWDFAAQNLARAGS